MTVILDASAVVCSAASSTAASIEARDAALALLAPVAVAAE